MSRNWPLYTAIGVTALIGLAAAVLSLFPPVVGNQVVEVTAASPVLTSDLSQGYVWGLGTGILLTTLFLLAPASRNGK